MGPLMLRSRCRPLLLKKKYGIQSQGRALCAVQDLAVSMPCLHRAFCSLGLQVRRAELAGPSTCCGAVSKTASVGVEIREACAVECCSKKTDREAFRICLLEAPIEGTDVGL